MSDLSHLPRRAVLSIERLAKKAGPAILSLPVFVLPDREMHGVPAFTTADGLFIAKSVVQREPQNIDVYVAHEIGHHVVGDPEIRSKFPRQIANDAEDYKINQIIYELWKLDVMKVEHEGLRRKRFDNYSIYKIACCLNKGGAGCLLPHNQASHPAILEAASDLKRKIAALPIGRTAGIKIAHDIVPIPEKDAANLYAALRKHYGKVQTTNLSSVNVDQLVRALWARLMLPKPVHDIDSKQTTLDNTQALAVVPRLQKIRAVVHNDSELAMLAVVTLVKKFDEYDKILKKQIDKLQQTILRNSALFGDKNRAKRLKAKRIVARAAKRLAVLKALPDLHALLKDRKTPIKVLREKRAAPKLTFRPQKVGEVMPRLVRRNSLITAIDWIIKNAHVELDEVKGLKKRFGSLLKEMVEQDVEQDDENNMPSKTPEQDENEDGAEGNKATGAKNGAAPPGKQLNPDDTGTATEPIEGEDDDADEQEPESDEDDDSDGSGADGDGEESDDDPDEQDEGEDGEDGEAESDASDEPDSAEPEDGTPEEGEPEDEQTAPGITIIVGGPKPTQPEPVEEPDPLAKVEAALQKLSGGGGSGSGEGGSGGSQHALDVIMENRKLLSKIIVSAEEFGEQLQTSNTRNLDELNPVESSLRYGNDLPRIIPGELAKMKNKYTRLSFFADLANSALLQSTGTSSKRGSVVFALDCSGSMAGKPYALAAGFVMAMIKMLKEQKRGAALIKFSGGIDSVIEFDRDKPTMVQVLEALCSPSMGGTCFNEVLLRSFDIHTNNRWRQTQVLLITDGGDSVNASTMLLKPKTVSVKGVLCSGKQSIEHIHDCVSVGRKGMNLTLTKLGNQIL